MARTKSSRGMEPFKMRSSETPYPFLGKIGKGIANLAKASPIGQAVKALKGNNAGADMGGADDVNTKIDEIHEALVGGEMGEMGGDMNEGQTLARAAKDAAMTKKAGPMYHKPHVDADGNIVKLSTKTKDSKGTNHYHSEEYTQDYQDRPDKKEKK
tara:strand:- start:63 stop:530 length:468 start_codon:yes stop_codon:yes gene_type:complete